MPSSLHRLRRTRAGLYRWARILGDVDAVASGRAPQRVTRRLVYRTVNRQVRRALRTAGL